VTVIELVSAVGAAIGGAVTVTKIIEVATSPGAVTVEVETTIDVLVMIEDEVSVVWVDEVLETLGIGGGACSNDLVGIGAGLPATGLEEVGTSGAGAVGKNGGTGLEVVVGTGAGAGA
jgi:hypothetical protein